MVPVLEEDRFLLFDPAGRMAWRRRPEQGLYAKMVDLPDQWVADSLAEPLGEALVERRLTHRLLRLKGRAFRLEALPVGLESGSVDEFLGAGPPRAVVLLIDELIQSFDKG